MRKKEIDMQSLEGRILGAIRKLSKGIDILIELQLEIIAHRSRLRNLIMAYNSKHGQEGCDDLIRAIVIDEALPNEEIKGAFDLTDIAFREALERIQHRDNMRK
ncbi:MAG: hypothetical protein Unbinned627contig1001_27 [Prokaryotic dsDNA virus sp.]|jgi:hypothetical protein|nr:MAG: hypothetical protein Unbinned627contig1001_27 [Prokaryotic dsDNA virus sp.]|tara:strand:- start:861 stop:1172 length:312 start_codon:yes stop_codon:yes gene_type:complete